MRLAVAILVLAAALSTAHAGDNDKARAHYEIGLGLYKLGDYHGALKEFAAGYALAPKPGFLLNLGQTYRKLGELGHARDMYRMFLAQVRADDPARPQAETILAEIDAALAAPPVAATPPPVAATPPPVAATPPPVAATPPATAAPLQVAAPAPRRSHRALRIGAIVVGGVGVALVGAGVGCGVAADGVARDLDALDARGGAYDGAKDDRYALDRGLEIGFLAGGAALAIGGAIVLAVKAR